MVPQINSTRRSFFYLKGMILLFCILWIAGSLSCNSPTGNSSSSGSGTGVGWTVTVSAFPTSISTSGAHTSGVIATVKDRSNSPAIRGTNVCVSAQRGGFAPPSSSSASDIPVTICETTTNDIGQLQATYTPLKTYSVESPPGSGTYVKKNLPIDPGPEVISATAMNASGYTTIQITD